MGRVVAQWGMGSAPGAQAAPRSPTAQAQQALYLSHSLLSDTKRWCGNFRRDWDLSGKNAGSYSLPSLLSFTRELAAGSARPPDYFL